MAAMLSVSDFNWPPYIHVAIDKKKLYAFILEKEKSIGIMSIMTIIGV